MKKNKNGTPRKDNNGKRRRLVYEGTVVPPIKDILFNVRLDVNNKIVLGYLSGNMRRNRILVVQGDRVKIEIGEFDSKRGRILYRFPRVLPKPHGIEQTTDDDKAMENPASPESLLDPERKNPMSGDSAEERDSKDTKPNQD